MNHHAPPGGWEPQEPAWMGDARRIAVELKAQVDRHIVNLTRFKRQGFFVWMSGGIIGQMVGMGIVELARWWWGLK